MDDDDNDAFAAAVVVYERVLQYLVWLVRSFSKLRPERNVHNNLDKWVHQKKCTRRPILLHRHVVQLAMPSPLGLHIESHATTFFE